jgi:hypothetical protein
LARQLAESGVEANVISNLARAPFGLQGFISMLHINDMIFNEIIR